MNVFGEILINGIKVDKEINLSLEFNETQIFSTSINSTNGSYSYPLFGLFFDEGYYTVKVFSENLTNSTSFYYSIPVTDISENITKAEIKIEKIEFPANVNRSEEFQIKVTVISLYADSTDVNIELKIPNWFKSTELIKSLPTLNVNTSEVFSWIVEAKRCGNYTLNVIAGNKEGASDSKAFNIVVKCQKKLKKINILVDQKKRDYELGEKIIFRIQLTDEAGNVLTPIPKKEKTFGIQTVSDYSLNLKLLLEGPRGNVSEIDFTVDEFNKKYLTELDTKRGFMPGLYKLIIKAWQTTDEGEIESEAAIEFSVGVIVVNTEKNIYLPGETAKILIGITDSKGAIPAEAEIIMEITSPSGQKTVLRTPEQIRKNIDGSYFTYYLVEETGNHSLKTIAITENFTAEHEELLIAKVFTDFEIIREIPILPEAGSDQSAVIKIKSNINATDLNITEYLPLDFLILETEGEIDRNEQNKTITWKVPEIKKGITITLNYTFETPLFVPRVYSLGPIQIVHKKSYDEGRYWNLIVADVVWFMYRWYYYYNDTDIEYIPQDPLTLCSAHNYTIHFLDVEEAADVKNLGVDITLQVKPEGEAAFTDVPTTGYYQGYGLWEGTNPISTGTEFTTKEIDCAVGTADRCYWDSWKLSLSSEASGEAQLRMYTSAYPAAGLKKTHIDNIRPINCSGANLAREIKVFTQEPDKVSNGFAMMISVPLANYETNQDIEANVSLEIYDDGGNKLDWYIIEGSNQTVIIPLSSSLGDWSVNVTKWHILTPESIDASRNYEARITIQDNISNTQVWSKTFNFYGL
ncbi:MAG: hypothetical protein ACE5J3_07530, partial [Methanosarcinales archaeon]